MSAGQIVLTIFLGAVILGFGFCWVYGLVHTVKVTFGAWDGEGRWAIASFVGWITVGGVLISGIAYGFDFSNPAERGFVLGSIGFLCHMGTHAILMAVGDWLRSRRSLTSSAQIVK